MDWFNWVGLIIIILMMIPNIIISIKCPSTFMNKVTNKLILFFEQFGRYGCFIFMIFNIPYTYFNFWFNDALITYIIINATLLIIYELTWFFVWKRYKQVAVYLLSIIPSLLFLIDGIMLLNIPLIVFSIIFSICHIFISLINSNK